MKWPHPDPWQVQGTLRKDYAVAAQNLWDKDPGAWTGTSALEDDRLGDLLDGCMILV